MDAVTNLTAILFDFGRLIQYNVCSEHEFRVRGAGIGARMPMK